MKALIFQNCNENIDRISAVVYKNFQGRNPTDIFVVILENQCLQKLFQRLSDLYQVTMGSKLLLNSLIHKNILPDVSTSDYSYSKVWEKVDYWKVQIFCEGHKNLKKILQFSWRYLKVRWSQNVFMKSSIFQNTT